MSTKFIENIVSSALVQTVFGFLGVRTSLKHHVASVDKWMDKSLLYYTYFTAVLTFMS